jgi:hypothetical protein
MPPENARHKINLPVEIEGYSRRQRPAPTAASTLPGFFFGPPHREQSPPVSLPRRGQWQLALAARSALVALPPPRPDRAERRASRACRQSAFSKCLSEEFLNHMNHL